MCFLTARSAHERTPTEPYPGNENTICVGVCFGEIAAAAVALSSSLHDLIPLAVDAVRLAFRGGVLAASVGEDIEAAAGGDRRASWALSVPRSTGLDSPEGLAALQLKQVRTVSVSRREEARTLTCVQGIPDHKRAWVSALGNVNVTVAGPPSSLDLVGEHLLSLGDSAKAPALRRLPIYAPYHTTHLFPREQTDAVLWQSPPLESFLGSATQRKMLIGGSDAYPGGEGAAGEFLADVLFEALAKPIDWEALRRSCKEAIAGDAAVRWRVRTFGPDLQGRSLAAGLQKMGCGNVEFDGEFGKMEEGEGEGSSVPIAIIGMAGRFPSANSPDEFWDLLKRRADVVREVRLERRLVAVREEA